MLFNLSVRHLLVYFIKQRNCSVSFLAYFALQVTIAFLCLFMKQFKFIAANRTISTLVIP